MRLKQWRLRQSTHAAMETETVHAAEGTVGDGLGQVHQVLAAFSSCRSSAMLEAQQWSPSEAPRRADTYQPTRQV